MHGSSDPALFSFYIFLSAATVVMGLITRGLEAAIAFHVANNLVASTVNALFAGGEVLTIDRSEGQGGGAALLIPAVMILFVLGTVWLLDRRRRTTPLR